MRLSTTVLSASAAGDQDRSPFHFSQVLFVRLCVHPFLLLIGVLLIIAVIADQIRLRIMANLQD